ncbi:MAG: PAS domain-containing protein [Elusimicrobia bacterium]|nr:PAS domain-containing protein [Elusimicrobiota bacterium]
MHTETEYYKSVLDNLTGGFLSVDLQGTVVYLNPMAGRILRLQETKALVGKVYSTALCSFPSLCDVIREALRTHKTVHRAEVSVLHADKPMVIGYSTLQVRNPKGEYLGIGIIFQDLTFVSRRG